jgi:prepilin-type processing-associated H-X9-DG protein
MGTVDFGPLVVGQGSLYPEYLTDPNLMFCPSDASTSQYLEMQKNAQGAWCTGYTHAHGSACARGVDTSYLYLGWVLDRTDARYGMVPASVLGIPNTPPGAEISLQSASFLGALVPQTMNPANFTGGLAPFADNDLNVGAPAGNAGGSSLMRFKEGIERFMITDINNPAASAMAQSQVWIMTDGVATRATAFSHVPGGANVLYMDGHVTFIRYPGEPPVNESMAIIVGLFATDF